MKLRKIGIILITIIVIGVLSGIGSITYATQTESTYLTLEPIRSSGYWYKANGGYAYKICKVDNVSLGAEGYTYNVTDYKKSTIYCLNEGKRIW